MGRAAARDLLTPGQTMPVLLQIDMMAAASQ
jgi:hypothetical protein